MASVSLNSVVSEFVSTWFRDEMAVRLINRPNIAEFQANITAQINLINKIANAHGNFYITGLSSTAAGLINNLFMVSSSSPDYRQKREVIAQQFVEKMLEMQNQLEGCSERWEVISAQPAKVSFESYTRPPAPSPRYLEAAGPAGPAAPPVKFITFGSLPVTPPPPKTLHDSISRATYEAISANSTDQDWLDRFVKEQIVKENQINALAAISHLTDTGQRREYLGKLDRELIVTFINEEIAIQPFAAALLAYDTPRDITNRDDWLGRIIYKILPLATSVDQRAVVNAVALEILDSTKRAKAVKSIDDFLVPGTTKARLSALQVELLTINKQDLQDPGTLHALRRIAETFSMLSGPAFTISITVK